MLPGMSKTIVVGYDDKEPAKRALERAIAEAKESGGTLVVVTVVEFPLDPEGPQSFGALDDSPARMIPLVVPPELEPVLAHARGRVAAESVQADFLWAAGWLEPTSQPRSSGRPAPTSPSDCELAEGAAGYLSEALGPSGPGFRLCEQARCHAEGTPSALGGRV
jgi:nucleotide-binding universal stress UspA family protein